MEKQPEKPESANLTQRNVFYQGAECCVQYPEAILGMGFQEFTTFHQEKGNDPLLNSRLEKKRISNGVSNVDLYGGTILIQDFKAGNNGIYKNLKELLDEEIDEASPLYDGLTLHNTGNPGVYFLVDEDGVPYLVHLAKTGDRVVQVRFGNLTCIRDGSGFSIEDHSPPEEVPNDVIFDSFLKTYMHVYSRVAVATENHVLINKSDKLEIGQPATPSSEVFQHTVRSAMSGVDESYAEDRFSTVPGISKTARKDLLKLTGIFEDEEDLYLHDPSRAVLITGPELERASEIIGALAASTGSAFVEEQGRFLRGRNSKQTEENLGQIFDRLVAENGPVLLLIHDLESVYRHESGKSVGVQALKRTLDYALYQKDDLYILATIEKPLTLSKQLIDTETFSQHFLLEMPGASSRIEILAAELAKYAIMDFSKGLKSRVSSGCDLNLPKLQRETVGLKTADLREVIRRAWLRNYGLEASKNGLSMQQSILDAISDVRDERK